MIRQFNPDVDPPTVVVYVQQNEEGPKVANAPLLQVDGGDSELTPGQGEQLIVALANQLALLEPMTRQSTDWHCPRWCAVTAEQHEAEGPALDGRQGGAIHKPREWEAGDSQLTEVRAYFETDLHRGNQALIYVGDVEIDARTARLMALHLLRAAAFAEIAEGDVL